jgi:hypothetical protein
MLQLTVTAKLSDVVLQDPFPSDGMWTLTVPAGQVKTVVISWDQFQRIASQVHLLEQAGFCTVQMESIQNGEVRGQENDLVGMPALDHVYVSGGGSGAVLALTGVVDLFLMGDQLLAQQDIAHVVLGDPLTPNACVDFISPTPGVAANDISVEIVDDAVPGPITVAFAGGVVTIDLHSTVITSANLAILLNATVPPTGTRGVLHVVRVGTGAGNVLVSARAALAGGSGAGLSVTFCGQPCLVTQSVPGALPTDPQQVLVDTPDLTGLALAGESVNLYLRSGSKKTMSTHELV